MTSDALRALIEQHGHGKNISQKVKDVAARTSIGEQSLWRYLRQGVPARAPGATLRALQSIQRRAATKS